MIGRPGTSNANQRGDKSKHGKETDQINKLEKKRVIMAGLALKNTQRDSDPGPVGADARRRSWLSFR